MSVRDKAVLTLAELSHVFVRFNNKDGTVTLGVEPVTVDRAWYEKEFGGQWEALVKSIDWDRVRLEASGRCLRLHFNEDDLPCGACIEAALLEEATFPIITEPVTSAE